MAGMGKLDAIERNARALSSARAHVMRSRTPIAPALVFRRSSDRIAALTTGILFAVSGARARPTPVQRFSTALGKGRGELQEGKP